MKRNLVLLGAGVVFLFCVSVDAQVTTGTISGAITDSSGAVLPGAKVVILNEDTGLSRTVAADAAGRYSAPSLSLGNYKVTAGLEGFQSEVRSGIVLTVGREAVVDFRLTVGAVTQSVEVKGEAPLVETSQSAVSYLVGDQTVRELPLNGRDLDQLILLNPGVSVAENASASAVYNGFGKRISVAGLPSEDSVYLLDGTFLNDFSRHVPAGPDGALIGVETVREFEVIANPYNAQYGGVLGGVFNAVSRSGTNGLHGDVFEFLRNSDMDAIPYFYVRTVPSAPRLPPFRRNQFGATLGGPIKRDKTFFFVAYEGMRNATTNTVTGYTPNASAHLGILPGLAAPIAISPKVAVYLPYFPLPNGSDLGTGIGQYLTNPTVPQSDDFWQGRFDHQFSSSDSFFARYTYGNASSSTPGVYSGFSTYAAENTRLLTLSETHIASSRALNTARFSFNRIIPQDIGTYPVATPAEQPVPGQTAPPGLAIGGGISSYEGFTQPSYVVITNRFNFTDTYNLTVGSHSLSWGGSFERLQLNSDQSSRPYGEWTFSSLTTFLQGTPASFRGNPPQFSETIHGVRQWYFGFFLQDDWRITSKLTLNLGVRWEPYTVPTEVNNRIQNLRYLTDAQQSTSNPLWLNKSWNNIGPRFGFAWNPLASGKTSVRGGIGLFYVPQDPAEWSIFTGKMQNPDYQFPDNGNFPNAVATVLKGLSITPAGTAYNVPYSNFKSQHALQYNLNVQQQLGTNGVLTIGYSGSRGMDLISPNDYNMPVPVFNGVSLAVPAGATNINPNFGLITTWATNASSWYNALTVGFQQRLTHGLQLGVAYTYSKAISENDSYAQANFSAGGGDGYIKDPWDLSSVKSLSNYDYRNLLRINYSYDILSPRGRSGLLKVAGPLLANWTWTGIVSAENGQPFTLTDGVSTPLTNLEVQTVSPNLVPGVPIVQGGPHQYYNPAAFSYAGSTALGNVGRNTVTGPGLTTWDMGLTKNMAFTERWHLQFRAETFNTLNHPNFSAPASQVFTATGARSPTAGVITNTVTPMRQIQLGLKLIF